jgi:hypothetical protein
LGFQLSLEWDPNPETNIIGYRLYYGLSGGQYTTSVSVGNQTTYTLGNLTDGKTHYFAVTAYNSYGESGYSNELVHIPATQANTAPVAVGGALNVTEDVSRGAALSASDADGDNLTFSIATQPTVGRVSVTASTGAYTYTPNANATGSDSFTFVAGDGALSSNTATVSVTISAVNDPPVANNDTARAKRNGAVTISVLGNDTDVEGNTLSLQSFTQGNSGTTARSGSAVAYTPDTGFTGTESFSYTVSDGRGGSDTGSVTVVVASTGETSQVVAALNVGGSAFTGSDGTAYRSDAYYSGVQTRVVGGSIGEPTDDTLYRSCRYGSFTYSIPVVDTGTCLLTLKFAEGATLEINSGGNSHVGSDGQFYTQDYGASTVNTWYSRTVSIAGTEDDILYSSEHYGSFSYNLPVNNGAYLVTLKFAETYYTVAGGRVFDVSIEDDQVLDNLDLFATAGRNVAYDFTYLVSVADGMLNITFQPVKGRPKI